MNSQRTEINEEHPFYSSVRESPEEVSCGFCHEALSTLHISLLLAIHLASCLTFLMVYLKPLHPEAIETSSVCLSPFWPIDSIVWTSCLELYLWPILYHFPTILFDFLISIFFCVCLFAVLEVKTLSNKPQVPEVASLLTRRRMNW